jgi:precorrin-6Y C5,15-methyltransferase (decarboxylating)
MSWDNIRIISSHGRDANVLGAVMTNNKTFILTGGEHSVKSICNLLHNNNLGQLDVYVGENLSYENECIVKSTVEELTFMDFENLSVMIVINNNILKGEYTTHGIEDTEFVRDEVPMTKGEVRSVSLSKLKLKENQTVYDIGAGTGSVSIEMALRCTQGIVYAIEKNEQAIELIKKNKKKFGANNLKIIKAEAPMGIEKLPPPDRVFIGGSSGNMESIVETVLKKNPKVRIVINVITIETLSEVVNCFKKFNLKNVDIVQLSISKSKKVGQYNMMIGQNPVFILSAEGCE